MDVILLEQNKIALYSLHLKTAKGKEAEIQVALHSTRPVSHIFSSAFGLFSCLHHGAKVLSLHPSSS
jgi:hypothetical protein